MFAIIKTGGKQLFVSQGDEIFVEKLDGNEGEKVNFTEILMVDGKVETPFVKGASVTGTILKQGKQKKIVVFHYKPKKTQHKKYGHRQSYTKIKIDQILLSATGLAVAEKKPVTTEKKITTKPTSSIEKKPAVIKPKSTTTKTTTAAKSAAKSSSTSSAKTEKSDK